MSVGGGLVALQLFGHLKRALKLFSVRMSPFTKFEGHWVDTMNPGEKKQQKTKEPLNTRICDLFSGKKYKIPHLRR